MTGTVSYSGLVVSLLLPWLFGCIWVRYLLRNTSRRNRFVVTGFGYFLGVFSTTVLLRMSDILGLGLNFTGIAIALAVLSVLGVALQFDRAVPQHCPNGDLAINRWQSLLLAILLALLAWRYLTLLQELLLRPLYAWDAWMNWAPKAIVWFQLGELVEYVKPQQWVIQAPDSNLYTLGNSRASEYPPTVPLILLWSMLGANTWDHSALFLPWILAALNLGLALYGQLRLNGCNALSAVIACYILLNLPYFNVHTVLAGYADIWLAAAFALSIFALQESHLSGSPGYALLFLLMAVMCSQLKLPGIVLAVILIAAGIRALLSPSAKSELIAIIVIASLFAATFLLGVDISIAGFGRVAISAELVAIPGMGEFTLDYHPVWWAFAESMFIMINWNIGCYLILAFCAAALIRGDVFKRISPAALAIIGALAFIVFSFIFTKHYKAAENFVTLNRALLYTVPAIVFYFCLRLGRTDNLTNTPAKESR